MEYEEIGGHLVPVWLAEFQDHLAYYYRCYPPPSYEERRHQLAQKRAAEVQTDAQRQIAKRNTDPSHVSPNGKAPSS